MGLFIQADQLRLILEKHTEWLRHEEGGERANLYDADLRCADLRGADLYEANLHGANLRSANLYGADLRDADLHGADLRDADLRDADLRDADLRGADLYEANLHGANLRSANLYGAHLHSANLRCANLRCADLRGANLYGADLRDADLRDADLRDADLHGADLRDADLHGADLRDADLRDADLRDADLSDTRNINTSKCAPDLSILYYQLPETKLIAYKYLRPDLTSPMQGFQYEIGRTYTFDDADCDQFNTCGAGGNLATLAWCERNKGCDDIIGVFSFEAKDIAAIPFTTDGKFRVKKMKFEKLLGNN